jgi:polysaccharide export outer membrane protein
MSRILKSLLFFVGSICASSMQAQSASAPEGLNPGDQVRIAVWRNPELSGDFTVSANGTLNHPLYREIQVTGIPISAVEDRLRAFLTRYTTNPQFVVQPLVKVVVSGEVRSPNLLSVPPETTVAQAVVLAGGPTQNSKLDRVRLLRQGQEITLNLNSADTQAAALQIKSGDQIIVPARSQIFRDIIGPIMSSIGAIAAVTNIILR